MRSLGGLQPKTFGGNTVWNRRRKRDKVVIFFPQTFAYVNQLEKMTLHHDLSSRNLLRVFSLDH